MAKRATVYFDEPTHKALRLKAAETDQTSRTSPTRRFIDHWSRTLTDLAAFRDRAPEPSLAFEEFVADLRRRGRL